VVTAVFVKASRRLNRKHEVPPFAGLVIPADSASVARGEHIARSIGTCTLCHGEDLGGEVYAEMGPLGRVVGPNLTHGRGGVPAEYSDEDWIRSIRYGVRRDSTSMLVMPSEVWVHFSDEDLASLIAYLKTLPPVDRELPRTELGLLGRALVGMGRLEILVAEKTEPFTRVPEVPPGPTVEYGGYLAKTSGCAGCHGYGFSGGRVAGPPDLPPASNLTPSGRIASWTESQFVEAMRTGKRPDGSVINEFMPWRILAGMTDEELHAIWLYLQSVPSKPFGFK
jgi:cytochrome c553